MIKFKKENVLLENIKFLHRLLSLLVALLTANIRISLSFILINFPNNFVNPFKLIKLLKYFNVFIININFRLEMETYKFKNKATNY